MVRRAHHIPTVLALAIVAAMILTSPAAAGWKRRWRQSACVPMPAATPQMAPTATGQLSPLTGDFLAMLNAARAARGLSPLAYDPGLASGAAANNGHQAARGLGHFVNVGCGQCSAMAFDAGTALMQWAASGPHAAILFDPAARRCGFACGGGYATANVGW